MGKETKTILRDADGQVCVFYFLEKVVEESFKLETIIFNSICNTFIYLGFVTFTIKKSFQFVVFLFLFVGWVY